MRPAAWLDSRGVGPLDRLGAWKENLSVPQTVLMALFVIAFMVLLSVARTGWKGFPGVLPVAREWWASVRQPLAQPTAGD